jgi:putative heme-binding domain-containing protein
MLRVAAALAALGCAPAPAADPPRVPLTTSKFVGSPDPPPPFRIVNAFPKLRFDHPVHMAADPSSDRLFVCEQGGKLWSFPNRPDATPDLVLDAPKDLAAAIPADARFDTLYALAFHPRFAENRTCFVCYTLKDQKRAEGRPDGSRVSRFTMSFDPPRIDPKSEQILFTWTQGGHNGCDLQFGPDGMLYASAGDAGPASPPDPIHTGQDISDLMSSILRVDVDRADPGKTYAIPKDNPFVDTTVRGRPARPEVWAYGLRNPWRMSFDPATGDLWVGDVGWEQWEMVYKVEKGGNYGWSITEARQPVHPADPPGPTPIRPPLIELPHTVANSVTGGFVYRGKKFPELAGAYVFGDWGTRRLWAARADGQRLTSLDEITAPDVRAIAFGRDNAGELYVMDYDAGTVLTWERNPDGGRPSPDFPRTLSASGLFSSVKDHAVAPGVYGFAVNAPQWQDGAAAARFVALPGTAAVMHHDPKKPIPGHAGWLKATFHFPADAVLLKTLTLAGKRVETQVLHWDAKDWKAYSYRWRADGTDADLVPADGAEAELTVDGKPRTWAFASRTQCLTCHNPWAEYPLAFAPEQLNRGDQLARLGELGLVRWAGKDDKPLPPPTAADLAKQRKLPDPADESLPLADRAKGYLHANCAHCHRFGGGGAVAFELTAFDPDKRFTGLFAPPLRGTFGLPDAKVIAPGEPDRSALLYRMAKVGRGRMPHLGSEAVDDKGVSLVRRWIASLGASPGKVDPPPADVAARLATPAAALMLACELREGCAPDFRAKVLAAAAKLPDGDIRDLFADELPRVGDPKLGPAPRSGAVLGRAGDAARGRALFLAERTQCVRCHKLDGQGKEVGPDLSALGGPRTREEFWESLVEPSRRVEPRYQSYLVRTADGRALTGLLAKRDAAGLVLRDGEGKEVAVAAADLEAVTPARESLMPTGLLANLTAQQAADLLAFLEATARGAKGP